MYWNWNRGTQIHEPVSRCEKAESWHNFQSRSSPMSNNKFQTGEVALTSQRWFGNSLCERLLVSMMMACVCFQGVSPVNLNPRIVYNHMDAVIMCSDWDPEPQNILESDGHFCLTLSLVRMKAVFWGKVHWSVGPEGWTSQRFIFITNTR